MIPISIKYPLNAISREYVPGGPDYHWRNQYHTVPFYPDAVPRKGDEPVLWGMTARVTYALAGLLREGRV